jgi:hypothetical protein
LDSFSHYDHILQNRPSSGLLMYPAQVIDKDASPTEYRNV